MNKALFIAGTDTGIGKTLVTGLLALSLAGRGAGVVTQKWVQTGSRIRPGPDLRFHLKMAGRKPRDFADDLLHMEPYVLSMPSSPHLAGRRQGKQVSSEKIRRSFEKLRSKYDVVLVEGTGGLLVPLNQRELIIDVVARLRIPVLLIAANRLGTINHTLLALEALRARRIPILGIVFSNAPGQNREIIKDNPAIIKTLGRVAVLGVLPRAKNIDALQRAFAPIGTKIAGQLKEVKK